jgi:LmbE family N-acetylglucosaminyl deacetylase
MMHASDSRAGCENELFAMCYSLVFQTTLGGAMKLDLLAIAAHPDDVELTCGGTLLKATDQGYKTGILDLTAGEMGTRGTPETR